REDGGVAGSAEESGDGASGSESSVAAAPGVAVPAIGSASFPPDMDCDDLLPKAEWFLHWSPPDFVRDFHDHLQAVTMLLALALALAGVPFAGADWNQGTMGTQLTYQPRRGVVFTSKAVALAIVAAVVGAVGAALAWAESYLAASSWGTTEMVDQVQRR